MQSLINRSLESFVRSAYGDAVWSEIATIARIEPRSFLAFSTVEDHLTRKVVLATAQNLGKPAEELLEDLGAWLVRLEPIRRLLRFSGPDFVEFVHSLDQLSGRAGLVLPSASLPVLTVVSLSPTEFEIGSDHLPSGWIWVLAGALRGMADDYGTLALISVDGRWLHLQIALSDHAVSRPFDLLPTLPEMVLR